MKKDVTLSIDNLHVTVGGKEVVRGIDLTIRPGQVHAIMGPNGSGKSSLVNALMGHPAYAVTAGTARFLGEDLLSLDSAERAGRGLFLAFQYPRDIAGVSLRSFLFAAYNAQMEARDPRAKRISPVKFKKFLEEEMEKLRMDPAFAERSLNQGFSGGEKKKAEVLQMTVLRPRLALLDETDSGLDIDALKIVAKGISGMRSLTFSALARSASSGRSPFSAIVVTHYARLLDYVAPDVVHVMVKGRIVESGGPDLARKLEKEGYTRFGVREEEKRRIPLD